MGGAGKKMKQFGSWAGKTVDPYNMTGLGTGGFKGSPPSAPDFASGAAEQARLSRNDVNGPFGSSTWAQGPDGRWTQNNSLSPELQAQVAKLTASMGNQLDPTATRDQAVDSAYRMQTSRLDPRFAQQQSSLETQLANEGFSRGDAGWQNAAADFGRERTDAYQQALYGAQSGAGNTAFAQALAANQTPYTQLAAIQGLANPSAQTSLSMAQSPQLLAAMMNQYGASADAYNATQDRKNSLLRGGASLVGAF